MSVLLETSLGDIVIDLEVDNCPKTCENFLKLCKAYYYNLNAFFNGVFLSISFVQIIDTLTVSKDFLAQTGDPTATGTGGESIWSYIASQSSSEISIPRYFPPEIQPKLKHNSKGTVSMAVAPALEGQKGGCGSQFFITLADNIDYLDGKHAVFGHVVEGLETLDKLNEVFVDQDGRPFKDVRIRHVIILGARRTCKSNTLELMIVGKQTILLMIHRVLLDHHLHQRDPPIILRASLKMKIHLQLCQRRRKRRYVAKRLLLPPHLRSKWLVIYRSPTFDLPKTFCLFANLIQ